MSSTAGVPSDGGAEAGSTSRPDLAQPTWRARAARVPWRIVVPVAVYLVLTVAGVTQSSIGIPVLREDPDHLSTPMIGEARQVRSDEFLTSTPLAIGVTASGEADDVNPLSAPQAFLTQVPSGPVSTLVFFDGTALTLGSVAPDSMLVAARWWLPFLLLALGCPAFFRRLTGSPWIGWFAAGLIVLNPASAWWSFTPSNILGFTIAGASCLQLACERHGTGRRAAAVAWGAAGAVLLARTPLLYQPWMLVVAPAILAATVAALLAERQGRGRAVLAIGAVGGAAVLLLAGVFLENRDAFAAVLGTSYPGHRVSSGAPQPLMDLFGATNLHVLTSDPTLVGSNPSEISSAYGVALVWAALLAVAGRRHLDTSRRVAIIALTFPTLGWLAWATMDFGRLGSHIPVVNLVPPARAADVIGLLGIVLCCLLLPAAPARGRFGTALLTGAVTALVAGYAGSELHHANLPDLSIRAVWVASVLTGAVVLLCTWRPRLWPGYALGTALAVFLVGTVNPVLFGLGDLRGSDAASQFLAEGDRARSADTVWATDAYALDTLLSSTGVPALSGRQLAGPDKDAWRQLAPDADEELWNRGGSFIWFRWTDAPGLTVSNPQADVIIVDAYPCTLADRVPDVRHLISSHPLSAGCLRAASEFEWGGGTRFVYDVVDD